MMDIVALAIICKLAIDGGNKVLEEYKKRKFSEAERELLIAAAKDGEFPIMHVDEVPDWIRVGGKDFGFVPPDGDFAIAAKYQGAFKNLCKRAYIEYDTGSLFRLTDIGFDKARELAGKNKKKR
jgi:hypothetical protein